jgi:CRISPR-associated protein (TIGR02584 family)
VFASQQTPYKKRILLCVIGLTPQIVTETLYALSKSEQPFYPDELHIITTAEGYKRLRLTLLGDTPGYLKKLLRDYQLPAISEQSIHINQLSTADGLEMLDIRTDADNKRVADIITATIAKLTQEDDSQLHVSIAGGRKTMGYFAGYALSLYGRAQDQLSHVLVSAPFESHPDFYYPTPYKQVIYSWPDKLPLDTSEAIVTLAHIPFVRIRHELPEALLIGQASFSETVARAQSVFAPIKLEINLSQKTITASGKDIPMAPVNFAFYWMLVESRLSLEEGVHYQITLGLGKRFLGYYERIVGKHSGKYEKAEKTLKSNEAKDMDKTYFEQRINGIKSAFEKVLGKEVARNYIVQTSNKHNQLKSLELSPNRIQIIKETA